jgi:8-oxo-dGTP pyrophosphatase MutT (NUDIX family)
MIRIIKFLRPVLVLALRFYWFFFRLFGWKTRGAKIILSHKDEILFVKHSYGRKYSFPGGSLKKGESPEDGIKREVKEELGITLDDVTFIDSFVPDIKYEHRRNTIFVFKAELTDKKVYIDNIEIEGFLWATPNNPPVLGHVNSQILDIYLRNSS